MILLEKEMITDILDDMKEWSFSRLNSFYICKRAWYMTYIMRRSEKSSFFAQYGTFAHSIFEKYNKGELEIFELGDYYNEHYYENVTEQAPPNNFVDLNETYFNSGYDYFSSYAGNDDETIGAEVPFSFYINVLGKDRKIVGYIDRISKDDKGYIVTDYKSKGKFKNKDEIKKYARQLYMYCIAVKEKYGQYPYKMIFNQFRTGKIITIKFNEKDLNETIQWIKDTIELIYNESEFEPTKNDFWCEHICGVGLEECEKT